MIMSEATIQEYMQGMGSTKDEVAQWLRSQGIKGAYGVFACPISRALRAAFPDTFCVHPAVVSPEHDKSIMVRTTEACRDFILSFDRGEYPDLEKYTAQVNRNPRQA